jgi:hypothetical protein
VAIAAAEPSDATAPTCVRPLSPKTLTLFSGHCTRGTGRAVRQSVCDPATAVRLGGLSDDIALVATELVSNALRAGSVLCSVVLCVGPRVIELRVSDDAAGEPRLGTPGPSDGHGRGLRIVTAVASSWGWYPSPLGKAVWARFVRSESAGSADEQDGDVVV